MDGMDYSVPHHAYPDLPYLDVEVRQDLLADAAAVALWAALIAGALASARSSRRGTIRD